jgi:hypothetical protein
MAISTSLRTPPGSAAITWWRYSSSRKRAIRS